jgi:peroxiredoxin
MTESRKNTGVGVIWPIAIIIMGIAVIFMAYQNYQLRKEIANLRSQVYPVSSIPSVESGDIASAFEAYLPDGREFYFSPDSLESPLVLAWFSYDCEPCLDVMAQWNVLAADFPEQVIGIGTENWYEGALFSKNDAGFPVLTLVSDQTKQDYDIYSTPQTIVVLPDGRIGYVKRGVLDEQSLEDIESILTTAK